MSLAFDNATSAVVATSTTATFDHVTSADDNRILLAAATSYGGGLVDTPTYGGDATTKLSTNAVADGQWNSYYLLAPKSGTNAFSFTAAAGTPNITWVLATYAGVDQTTPWDTVYSTSSGPSTGATIDDTLTSAKGEIVVAMAGAYSNPYEATLGGDLTTLRLDSGLGGTGGTAVRTYLADGGGLPAFTSRLNYAYEIGAFLVNVSLRPATAGKARGVKYFHDINDPYGRILDDLGRVVSPWELRPNRWIKVTGLFLPTSVRYPSFTQDPELAYIEEVSFSIRGGLKIKTSRGELTEVLLARAAGGKTL